MLRIVLALLLMIGTAQAQSVLSSSQGGTNNNNSGAVSGDLPIIGGSGAIGDSGYAPSGMPTTATGSTAVRTLAARATDIGVNVLDFGADPTASTDSSTAFNAAMTYLNTVCTGSSSSGNTGACLYKIPPGHYLITSTINWTGIQIVGMFVNGPGATLIGQTSGAPVVDAFGSKWFRINGLHISGSSTNTPNIGIQAGRSTTQSCGNNEWKDVMVDGYYTFASVYIMGCETSAYYSLQGRNNSTATGTHGLVLDTINAFNVTSAFVTAAAQYTNQSFDEAVFINGIFTTLATDAASSPIWMDKSEGLRMIGVYATTNSQQAVMLSSHFLPTSGTPDSINNAYLELHTEAGTGGALLYEFTITGANTQPAFNGFIYRTQIEHASTAVYYLDPGSSITSVIMEGARPIDTPIFPGSTIVFNAPSSWTVSGEYILPAGNGSAWNLTCNTNFLGTGYVGYSAVYCGSGAGLTGLPPSSVPSNIVIASASNTGAVSAIAVTAGAHYDIDSWCNHQQTTCQPAYAHLFPTVTVAAPGGGGTTATAAVATVSNTTNTVLDAYNSGGFIIPATAGTGWSVNDTFTMVGGTCATPPKWTVHAVTAGAGSGIATFTVNTVGNCSALPPQPITVASAVCSLGSCSGATISGLTWAVNTISVATSGSNYGSNPGVTIQTSPYNNVAATATSTVTASLSLTAGGGSVLMNTSGTTFGVSGTSGLPLINLSASISNATTFVASGSVTGTLTAAVNTDGMELENSGSVSTLTVKLPPILATSGQTFWLSSVGGITTLTVQTSSGGTITGAPTSIAAYSSRRFISDGTSWYPIL